MRRLLLLLSLSVFFCGCSTTGPIENIPADQKVALVSDIDPVMRGQKLGITIFEHKEWVEENSGFDVNAVVLRDIKADLNRDIKLVDGRDVGLIPKIERPEDLLNGPPPAELKQKLAAFGREWQVDRILLLQTSTVRDWIYNTIGEFEGFGNFSRLGFGSSRNLAYAVFWIRVFDCKTGQFTGGTVVKQAQMVPGVGWHDSWKEYSPDEQRVLIRGLEAVIKECAPALLAEAGLTDLKLEAIGQRPRMETTSLASQLLMPGSSRLQSSVPEGNELEIPDGVSRAAARKAIIAGMSEHGWTLQTDTNDRMVAVYRKGKKEAVTTFTFTDHSIILTPEGYEIQDDGKRMPVEYNHRWNNYLKESIVEALMKTPADAVPK